MSKELLHESTIRMNTLQSTLGLIISGYAGLLATGEIVDRRKFPIAIPCQENELMRTPKPKPLLKNEDFKIGDTVQFTLEFGFKPLQWIIHSIESDEDGMITIQDEKRENAALISKDDLFINSIFKV